MENTQEKLKEEYASLNEKNLNKKISEAMLQIILLESPEDGYPVYEHVMKNFSQSEMAHIVCLFVGKQMMEKLEKDDKFKELCKIIKVAHDIEKTEN